MLLFLFCRGGARKLSRTLTVRLRLITIAGASSGKPFLVTVVTAAVLFSLLSQHQRPCHPQAETKVMSDFSNSILLLISIISSDDTGAVS